MAPVTELPVPKVWPFQKDCLVDSKNQIWDSAKEEIVHLEGAQDRNPETWNIAKFRTLHYPQVEFRNSGTQHNHTWGQSKGQTLHLHVLRLGLVTSRPSCSGSVCKVISGLIRIKSVVQVIFGL